MTNLIFINKKISCNLIKKKNGIILNFNNKYFFYYFFFFIKESSMLINNNVGFLKIEKFKKSNIVEINNFLNNYSFFFLKKISFNGKGFKLKKIKEKTIFNFNNSHIKILIEKRNKLIKNNKNSFFIISKNNFLKNNNLLRFVKNLFKFNIFTKRGVKLSRQINLVKKIKKK